ALSGLMQAGWRALFRRAIEVKLRKAVKVITACAILHNICIDAGDMDHAPVPVRRPPRPRPPVEEVSGDAFRNLL
ncbi:Protein ANTAGONIST OF LIKE HETEROCHROMATIN PROTEIN 1, partial [Frankliniella fusca]